MEFEKITENVENISLLSDTPAMPTDLLKKEFDKGNKAIKEKFNKLVDDLNEAEFISSDDDILKKHIITACIVRTSSIASVETALTLTEQSKVGNKLSIENGKVIIGKGVKKVLVSAKALLDDTQITNSFFYLYHNSGIINRGDTYGTYNSIGLPPMLVNVNEGDTFSLAVLTGTNASVYDGTYITVEVVE